MASRTATRLQLNRTDITSDYQMLVSDVWITISGSAALTLVAAIEVPAGFTCWVTNRTSATRTINAKGSDTIRSSINNIPAGNQGLVSGQTTMLISDGTSEWNTLHTQN